VAQKYQEIVEEDLNVGTGAVWVTAPSGGELRSIQVGLHTFARGQKEYTATWAPGAIAAGLKASTTVTVPDAAVADFVIASHDQMLTNPLRISGHVSAANTAKVVIHNPTASSVTVPSGTVSVLVFPVRAQTPAPPASLTGISGMVYCSDLGGVGEIPYEGSTVTIYIRNSGGTMYEYASEVTGADGLYSFLNIPALDEFAFDESYGGVFLVRFKWTHGATVYGGNIPTYDQYLTLDIENTNQYLGVTCAA
jgi:hypothetical protein